MASPGQNITLHTLVYDINI